ncbi:GNAT family N-acetyltransferase RibT [Lentibacillus halophilus]|uniref:GNAT family N-acetyltransferase RibT n=1 Tax=Lentibacillus halophilus TaxID=295065 RepID=A0ABN0ZD87_9BACI
MLIRYKKNHEKIAMGLLSFMPEEKDVKKLQQTIKEYEANQDWHLFLWKEEDVIGTIGIRIEDGINAVIQHISVNPSHRDSGVGQQMVQEIRQMYGDKYAVCADDVTQHFFNKCSDTDQQNGKDD